MSDLTNSESGSQPVLDLPATPPLASAEAVVPAFSLEAVGASAAPEPAPLTQPLPPAADSPPPPASPLLRAWRLLAGIAALAAAWGFLILLTLLALTGWDFAQGSQTLLVRAGVGVAAALGVVWLAISVIACLLAGAYCIMLAVTRRSW